MTVAMGIAIEFGSGEFRSLRREGGRLLARRASTDYLVVGPDKARGRVLERSQEEMARCDEGYIVFGSAAVDLCDLLSLPLQSAIESGSVRENDPVSRQFLGALVEGLLPAASQPKECCVVIAGEPDATRDDIEPDDAFLLQLVRLRGYEPEAISPGMGLILAECANSGYTGIAFKMGIGQIDVSVTYQTRELLRFTIPRGGASIDRYLAIAANSYVRLQDGREVLDIRPIRQWRESLTSIERIVDARTLDLRNQLREILFLTLFRLRQEMSPEILKRLPARIPLVLGGSVSEPAGMEKLLAQMIKEADLPVEISQVRKVRDARFAPLRGGLIVNEMRNSTRGKAA